MLHCHNICLYEDLFLIKWQHQIESNRCCRHSTSSPRPAPYTVIVQLANQRQLIPPLPSPSLPCSQSHPRLVTSLHDLKLRRRRRFDVCANPRMRMWTCHGIQTSTTMEMETAPVAALHARLVFGGSARLGASLLTRMRSVSHSIRRNSPRQYLPSSKREK